MPGIDREYISHPSFGKITLGKPHGNSIKLFGSEVKHRSCVSLTVETADLVQDVHSDSVFGRKHVVELYMSEAQWAHMLSSFGDGSGTPVTLRWTQENGHIEAPPDVPTMVDVQRREVENTVQDLGRQMQELEDRFSLMLKMPTVRKKDLEALRMGMNVLRTHLFSNLPYYEQATIERMEKEVAKARVEIEALVNNALHRAGVKAISEGKETLQLGASNGNT